ELLERLRGFFVEVDGPRASAGAARARAPLPPTVGLLAPSRVAAGAGAALALGLARAHGSSCAVLCHWDPLPGGAPPVRSAGRAAAALRARGMAADAGGLLVRVTLEDDTALAAAACARADSVVPGPAVLAVARPRDAG